MPEIEQQTSRRSFLATAAVGWAAFTGCLGGLLAATGRFMFPNVLFEKPSVFKAGFPQDLGVGDVDERFKETRGVWLVRNERGIYALSTVCTHLGCTPNWIANANKFKCPCHGSGFRKDGMNVEGPAPRPLERFRISLGDDGGIVVDTSKKFTKPGQWDDPEAILRV